MSLLNNLLKKNPAVLSKYVTVAYTVVDKTVGPLNRLMVHLMEIQGIDPRTQPGETARKVLAKAMDQVQDPEDFETDFNFGAIKGFEKTNMKLAHLNLTKEQFKKATDLTFVQDVQPMQVSKNMGLVGTKALSVDHKYEDALSELKEFMDKYGVSLTHVPLSADAAEKAKETLKRYVTRRQEKVVVESKRQPTSVGSPKKTSKPKAIKTFGKKGVFRRVKDED